MSATHSRGQRRRSRVADGVSTRRLTARRALRREDLALPTLEAGRALLGSLLVRDDADGPRVARVVEVEAYIGEDDLASHARFGRTARNAVMYGPPGIAYVYLVYGMYDCLNVVTEPAGRPAAVLIRAVEPVEGAAAMRRARITRARRRAPPDSGPGIEAGSAPRPGSVDRLQRLPDARLASGPGLVTAAFDITRADTGSDLLDPVAALRLEPGMPPAEIVTTPRVGIAYAVEPWRSLPWRFLDPASPAVSRSQTRG
jgi:DNA-3-methyladenine glycosylase